MSNEEPITFNPNTVTGNVHRDVKLTTAIFKLQNAGDDPTLLPSVQLELPDDFDLDGDELAAMCAHLGVAAVSSDLPPDPAEFAGAPDDPLPEDISPANKPDPVEAAPTMTQDEARDAVVEWEKKLAQARGARMGADQKARDLRGKLGVAVQAFVTGFIQLTPDQNARQMIASEQARKAAGIPLGRPRPVLGPSVVDQAAGSANGHSANRSYSQKFRRGASPIKGALNFDPRKGPVAKLPSDR